MTLFYKVTGINVVEEAYKTTNLFFNEDDIRINFDKFLSNEFHFVFITGYSGSGKSTLGAELAMKYKVDYVELDHFIYQLYNMQEDRIDKISDSLIYKYYTSHKNRIKDPMKNKNISERDKVLIFEDETDKLITWLIKKCNKRMIIDGVQLVRYMAMHNECDKYPIIFKGTSKYGSMFRNIKRDVNSWNKFINLIKSFPEFKKWYDAMETEQNYARLRTLPPK